MTENEKRPLIFYLPDIPMLYRKIPAKAHRKRVETVHQGVRNLSHLQIAGHDPEQGDAVVLPAVHDLPLLLQRADHQDRFPGCHRQEKVTPSENHLDRHLDCLDHHPGHPGSASPSISLYLTSLVFGISCG